MLRVKSDKSDWFWSQSIVFTKPFKTGMSLKWARGPQRSNECACLSRARARLKHAHSFDRCGGQRSRFLVLTKRSAASGDENGLLSTLRKSWAFSIYQKIPENSRNVVGKCLSAKDVFHLTHSSHSSQAPFTVRCISRQNTKWRHNCYWLTNARLLFRR